MEHNVTKQELKKTRHEENHHKDLVEKLIPHEDRQTGE